MLSHAHTLLLCENQSNHCYPRGAEKHIFHLQMSHYLCRAANGAAQVITTAAFRTHTHTLPGLMCVLMHAFRLLTNRIHEPWLMNTSINICATLAANTSTHCSRTQQPCCLVTKLTFTKIISLSKVMRGYGNVKERGREGWKTNMGKWDSGEWADCKRWAEVW